MAYAVSLLLVASLFSGFSNGAEAAPEYREDLSTKLGKILCAPQTSVKKTLQEQVYDAQIDARLIESFASNEITTKMLRKKAEALASMKRFGGFTYGMCNDRKGWVAATPAAQAVKVTSDAVSLPIKDLRSSCKDSRIDFAATNGGASLPIAMKQKVSLQSLTSKYSSGMLEITCQPKFPKWVGPVVWYMIPVGNQTTMNLPTSAKLDKNPASFVGWVNQLRNKAGLKPAVANDALARGATLLTIDTSVTHNRNQTKSVRTKIEATDKIETIGEIRARGTTVEDLAWMFWFSPTHRDLLLSPELTNIGFAVKEVGTEVLVVGLGGKEQRSVTASRTKTPSAKK